jgi:drug/metabolite transporter (DMT)-like permease
VDQGTERTRQGRRKATAIGAIAVLLWASLAALTGSLGEIPPFQLLAMAFAIAFAAGCLWLLATGGPSRFRLLAQPPLFWLLATFGLYAYHALYFLALRLALAAEANLINYLWPLLIVLFSALLPGAEGLRPRQLLGASMGLLGTGLLIASGGGLGGAGASLRGYAAALACALVWSSYSVLNRRFSAVPSEAMIGICGAVALLGLLTHLTIEPPGFRPSAAEALAIAAMGIGPLGLAFLAWDHGTKHGDLPVLGTLAYAAPILSTLLLVVLGRAAPSLALAAACALVAGGGWIAARSAPVR